MKITIVSGIYPPDAGGPSSFVPLLCESLVDRGYRVDTIVLSQDINLENQTKYNLKRIKRDMNRFIRMIYSIFIIYKSAKTSQLVFSNTLDFEACIGAKLARKPFIMKVVGDIAWERATLINSFVGTIDDYQCINQTIKFYLRNIYRNIPIHLSNKVVVPSYYLKDLVNGWVGEKKDVAVINNTINHKFDINSRNDLQLDLNGKINICIISRLVPHKSIDTIIDAVSRLGYDIVLHIVGDGPEMSKLAASAKKLNVNAKFYGYRPKEFVMQRLNTSHIYIQNSSYEGFPHAIAEAMIMGVPVIASDVGGTNELIDNGVDGILFEYNSLDALSKAINNLLLNPELYQTISRNASAKGETFCDCNAMIDKYTDLFTNAMYV